MSTNLGYNIGKEKDREKEKVGDRLAKLKEKERQRAGARDKTK